MPRAPHAPARWFPPRRQSPDSRCNGNNCRKDVRESARGPARRLLQQILCRHQHSRRTEAALQRVAVAERRLQIGDLTAVGQSFDRLNRCVMRLYRQHQAGAHDFAVDAHGAGAANPVLAPDMRAGQFQMLPQEVRQIQPRQHMRIDALAIDFERNGTGVTPVAPAPRSGRESSVDTQRASSTFARCRRMAGVAC